MPNIAVILPAYNEEKTLAETIAGFHKELPQALFVVIDNNSSDNTAVIATELLSKPDIKGVVLSEPRQGKGNAIRKAFGLIEADIYILADADLTYPPEQVHQLLQPVIEHRADMVVGDRISDGHYGRENKRKFHGFGNSLVCRLVNFLFKADLHDIMSGYRACSRVFVRHYPILVDGFQIETEMTLHALDKRFSIVETPVNYLDRPKGSASKLNTYKDGLKILITIANIFRHYRPLLFFGVIAAVLICGSLLAGFPAISDWLKYKYIYHVPLAILATGLAILSALSLTLALTLDSLSHQNKLLYELQLMNGRERRP